MALSPTLSRRSAPLSGCRILVLEDEYFLADDITRALRSAGAEIAGPVGQIDDALPIINDGGVLDGAVLDVNIHGEMVFPVAQELKARQVPFVFTTGYDKVSIAPQFHDVMLWEKPIDVAALVRGLAGLIGKPKT
ncbi:response regulator [Bradyrhizobium iriomotense]|uniref:response regulator n=1 Tax=Bradyrhizobium iriomotense TaxID=441950 RepID=UPI001B8A42EF|nr:response regulator [Bradyrhizobium iriomotense]MBR1127968.1 response regulator [Bradyrhizobium iriomotense]